MSFINTAIRLNEDILTSVFLVPVIVQISTGLAMQSLGIYIQISCLLVVLGLINWLVG